MSESIRRVSIPAWVDELRQDARHAVRVLRRNAGFSAVVIAILALGVGANSAIFSVIRGLLLAPPPYDNHGLVRLGETAPRAAGYSGAIAGPNFQDWAQQNTVFEAIAAVTGGGATLSGAAGGPVHVEARTVSASYFDVFGLHPILGRTFAPDEELPAKKHVVVIGYRLWVSQFGSDPGVLGTRVRIDGDLYTVIGVMPARTAVEVFDPALWRPGDLGRGGVLTPEGKTSRDARDLRWAAARLKPGVTLEQARSEMSVIGERLARAYPDSNQGWGVAVELWPRPVAPGFERSLYLLLAAVGMVLLIGCANVANLTLARGTARAREMATRAALGARRGRLARQVLTEHVVIALAGGACSVVVGYALLTVVTAALPSTGVLKAVPTDTTIAMDAPVWLFALMLSVLSGVLSGLGPAIGVTRGSLTRTPRRIRSSLVVVEIALAFVLLASTALLLRSFVALQERIGAGFDSTNVLTARLPIPPTRFAERRDLNLYLDRIAESVQSVPGVRDVAFTEGLPTQGTPFGRGFQVTDQPLLQPALRPASGFKTVSPAYFRAVGLQFIAGRALTDRDRNGTPLVLVVNETFVRTYLPGFDPIGKRLLMEPYGVRDVWEVVGVVADEGLSWEGKPEAIVYATREQNPSDYLALVVRGTLDTTRLQESMRRAVSAVDRDQALADMQPLDQLKTEFMASDRLRSILLGVFAAVALALAALGLYGVLSFTVAQRRREIGIRAALGATTASLVTMVVRQGMIMTVGGLVVGVFGAFAASRLLSTLVVGIVPFNTTTMAAVAGMLTTVALVASYLPARRAANVDPSVTFRTE